MQKKILVIFIIIMFLISSFALNVFATVQSVSFKLTASKNNYTSENENIVVTLRLNSITSDRGIISYSGVLEYDTNALKFERFERCGDWSTPSYNQNNGNFLSENASLLTEGSDLCRIVFSSKVNNVSNAMVTVKDLIVADGTGIKEAGNVSSSININIQAETGGETQGGAGSTSPNEGRTPEANNPNGNPQGEQGGTSNEQGGTSGGSSGATSGSGQQSSSNSGSSNGSAGGSSQSQSGSKSSGNNSGTSSGGSTNSNSNPEQNNGSNLSERNTSVTLNIIENTITNEVNNEIGNRVDNSNTIRNTLRNSVANNTIPDLGDDLPEEESNSFIIILIVIAVCGVAIFGIRIVLLNKKNKKK